MSSLPWFKFYPRAWTGNPQLRIVSLAARALWIEMLSLMHDADRYGYLVVGGKPLSLQQLARAVSAPEVEVEGLLNELEVAGVFHVDRKGRIHSPRMIKQRQMSENGRAAVNKRYAQKSENTGEFTHPSRVPSTKKKESRGQKTNVREEPVGSSEAVRITDNWVPKPEALEKTAAIRPDLAGSALEAEIDRFRSYWRANGTPNAFKREWDAAWYFWIADAQRKATTSPPAARRQSGVRLHRMLHPELFAECEKVQEKPAPTDDWWFPDHLVEEAQRGLARRE